MNIGEAIELLKSGKRVARSGWNGKDMWLLLVSEERWSTGIETGARRLPWIGMKTVNDGFGPWLASQADLLANDWFEVV